jgi:hypothetical protein
LKPWNSFIAVLPQFDNRGSCFMKDKTLPDIDIFHSKGTTEPLEAGDNALAPDIRARYGQGFVGNRVSLFLRRASRSPLAGEKCLSLANDLLRRWRKNEGPSSFAAPPLPFFSGTYGLRTVNSYEEPGVRGMKLPQLPEARAFSETHYETFADRPDFTGGIMISDRPFSDTTFIGQVARNAAPKPEVSSSLSTIKTNKKRFGHTGQVPSSTQSGKTDDKVAYKPDTISGGTIKPAETGLVKENLSGKEAVAKQIDPLHLAPMVMLRHQGPVLVRRYFREAGHPPDRSRKNSHPDTLRIVGQARIQTDSTQSVIPSNRSSMGLIMHRKDIALRKDPFYPQAGKISEIQINRVNAVSASDAEITGSTVDGEVRSNLAINNTQPSPPVFGGGNFRAFGAPFTEAGNTVHVPLILSRKPAVHDSFQDNNEGSAGVEIIEKPDKSATHGSGMPNLHNVVDAIPFNNVSWRQIIQTAPTSLEPHFLLRDVRPFVLRKISSFVGTPLTKSKALPPSGRHDLSFNGLQLLENPSYEAVRDSQSLLRGSHINPKSQSILMRYAMNGNSSPVTDICGKATAYSKEQTDSTSDSGISAFIRPFSGDDAVKTTSDGSLRATEIRRRFRTELPLVKIERNPGHVFSETVTGRLKGGAATQNVLHGFPQRSPDINSGTAGAAATPSVLAPGPGDGGLPSASPPNGINAASVNVEKIADEVYAIIERRLTIEKERRGL